MKKSILKSFALALCLGLSTVGVHAEDDKVQITILEGEHGNVVINGEVKEPGVYEYDKGIRFDFYVQGDPGYHFDHWMIDGEWEEGVFGQKGGLRISSLSNDMTIQPFTTECTEFEYKNAVEATCTEDGYTGDVYCVKCMDKVRDGEVIPAAHHYENGVCTGCGAIEEGYSEYEYYVSGSTTPGKEYNKAIGFEDLQDEYYVYVGDFLNLNTALTWAYEPSGWYMNGDNATAGGTDEEYFENLLGSSDLFVVHPIKACTEEFYFKRYGIEKTVTVHCIDKGEVVKESTTEVKIADDISADDAAAIEETIEKASVSNVPESLTSAAMDELLEGIDTENQIVKVEVVSTITVTAADLTSDKKSITFEITPTAVVTVDGETVKTVDLKNIQLNQDGKIVVTLPTNGLDVKEIIHESEGYDTEYIHDFTDNGDGTVSFAISHFSSFTLSEEVTVPAATPAPDKTVPNTGDHNGAVLYGGMGLIALMGAAVLMMFRRKHA